MSHQLLRQLLRQFAFTMLIWVTPITWAGAFQNQTAPGRTTVGDAPGNNADALVQEAYKRTKTAKAEADYTSIIQLCRQISAIPAASAETMKYARQLAAWAYNRRGEAYIEAAAQPALDATRKKQLDGQALADFQAAIASDPTKWKAFLNRGVSRGVQGQYAQALADFDQVVRLNPDSANGWFNRAEIYFQQGNFAKAVGDYSRAIRLSPKDEQAFTHRAQAYLQLKQISAAMSDYAHALKIKPKNALVYVSRGDAYQHLRQWSQAASDYRTAIQTDARLGRAYEGAAWLMATCPDANYRDPQRALRAAQLAHQLSENAGKPSAHVLDILAAAQANAGDFDAAVATIQKAIQQTTPAAQTILKKRLNSYQKKQPHRQ